MPLLTPHVPNGLIDLMKELAKEVLRDKPENLYEFAAVHFEKQLQQRDGSLDKNYEQFTAFENLFDGQQRFAIPYNSRYICQRPIKIQPIWQPKMSKADVMASFKAMESIHEEDVLTENLYTDEKYENAIYIIQRYYRRYAAKKKIPPSPALSEVTAAIIIQRTMRRLFSNKIKLKTEGGVDHPVKQQHNGLAQDDVDNVSEAASYTSSSTIQLLADSQEGRENRSSGRREVILDGGADEDDDGSTGSGFKEQATTTATTTVTQDVEELLKPPSEEETSEEPPTEQPPVAEPEAKVEDNSELEAGATEVKEKSIADENGKSDELHKEETTLEHPTKALDVNAGKSFAWFGFSKNDFHKQDTSTAHIGIFPTKLGSYGQQNSIHTDTVELDSNSSVPTQTKHHVVADKRFPLSYPQSLGATPDTLPAISPQPFGASEGTFAVRLQGNAYAQSDTAYPYEPPVQMRKFDPDTGELFKVYDVFYQDRDDPDFSDSLNESTMEKDSLENEDLDVDSLESNEYVTHVSGIVKREVKPDEDSLNGDVNEEGAKSMELERGPTYLYGIHPPRTPVMERKNSRNKNLTENKKVHSERDLGVAFKSLTKEDGISRDKSEEELSLESKDSTSDESGVTQIENVVDKHEEAIIESGDDKKLPDDIDVDSVKTETISAKDSTHLELTPSEGDTGREHEHSEIKDLKLELGKVLSDKGQADHKIESIPEIKAKPASASKSGSMDGTEDVSVSEKSSRSGSSDSSRQRSRDKADQKSGTQILDAGALLIAADRIARDEDFLKPRESRKDSWMSATSTIPDTHRQKRSLHEDDLPLGVCPKVTSIDEKVLVARVKDFPDAPSDIKETSYLDSSIDKDMNDKNPKHEVHTIAAPSNGSSSSLKLTAPKFPHPHPTIDDFTDLYGSNDLNRPASTLPEPQEVKLQPKEVQGRMHPYTGLDDRDIVSEFHLQDSQHSDDRTMRILDHDINTNAGGIEMKKHTEHREQSPFGSKTKFSYEGDIKPRNEEGIVNMDEQRAYTDESDVAKDVSISIVSATPSETTKDSSTLAENVRSSQDEVKRDSIISDTRNNTSAKVKNSTKTLGPITDEEKRDILDGKESDSSSKISSGKPIERAEHDPKLVHTIMSSSSSRDSSLLRSSSSQKDSEEFVDPNTKLEPGTYTDLKNKDEYNVKKYPADTELKITDQLREGASISATQHTEHSDKSLDKDTDIFDNTELAFEKKLVPGSQSEPVKTTVTKIDQLDTLSKETVNERKPKTLATFKEQKVSINLVSDEQQGSQYLFKDDKPLASELKTSISDLIDVGHTQIDDNEAINLLKGETVTERYDFGDSIHKDTYDMSKKQLTHMTSVKDDSLKDSAETSLSKIDTKDVSLKISTKKSDDDSDVTGYTKKEESKSESVGIILKDLDPQSEEMFGKLEGKMKLSIEKLKDVVHAREIIDPKPETQKKALEVSLCKEREYDSGVTKVSKIEVSKEPTSATAEMILKDLHPKLEKNIDKIEEEVNPVIEELQDAVSHVDDARKIIDAEPETQKKALEVSLGKESEDDSGVGKVPKTEISKEPTSTIAEIILKDLEPKLEKEIEALEEELKPVIAKLKDTVASVVDSREITDQKSETQKKVLEVSFGKESENDSDVATVSKIEVTKETTSTTADVILKDLDPKLEKNIDKFEEEVNPMIGELKDAVSPADNARKITDPEPETQKKALEVSLGKEREDDSGVGKVSTIKVSKEPTSTTAEIILKDLDTKLEKEIEALEEEVKPVIAKLKDTVAPVVDSREITDQKSETQKKALEVSLGKESEDDSGITKVSKIEVSKEPTSTTAEIILKDLDPKPEKKIEALEQEMKPVIAKLKHTVASVVDSREITDQKSETQKKALEVSLGKESEDDSVVGKVSRIEVSKEPTSTTAEIILKDLDPKPEKKIEALEEEVKPVIAKLNDAFAPVVDSREITDQKSETQKKALEVSLGKESEDDSGVGNVSKIEVSKEPTSTTAEIILKDLDPKPEKKIEALEEEVKPVIAKLKDTVAPVVDSREITDQKSETQKKALEVSLGKESEDDSVVGKVSRIEVSKEPTSTTAEIILKDLDPKPEKKIEALEEEVKPVIAKLNDTVAPVVDSREITDQKSETQKKTLEVSLGKESEDDRGVGKVSKIEVSKEPTSTTAETILKDLDPKPEKKIEALEEEVKPVIAKLKDTVAPVIDSREITDQKSETQKKALEVSLGKESEDDSVVGKVSRIEVSKAPTSTTAEIILKDLDPKPEKKIEAMEEEVKPVIAKLNDTVAPVVDSREITDQKSETQKKTLEVSLGKESEDDRGVGKVSKIEVSKEPTSTTAETILKDLDPKPEKKIEALEEEVKPVIAKLKDTVAPVIDSREITDQKSETQKKALEVSLGKESEDDSVVGKVSRIEVSKEPTSTTAEIILKDLDPKPEKKIEALEEEVKPVIAKLNDAFAPVVDSREITDQKSETQKKALEVSLGKESEADSVVGKVSRIEVSKEPTSTPAEIILKDLDPKPDKKIEALEEEVKPVITKLKDTVAPVVDSREITDQKSETQKKALEVSLGKESEDDSGVGKVSKIEVSKEPTSTTAEIILKDLDPKPEKKIEALEEEVKPVIAKLKDTVAPVVDSREITDPKSETQKKALEVSLGKESEDDSGVGKVSKIEVSIEPTSTTAEIIPKDIDPKPEKKIEALEEEVKPVIAKLKDTVAPVVDSKEITDQKSETQKKALEVSLGKESEDDSGVGKVSRIEVSKEPTSTTAEIILKDLDPKLEKEIEALEEEMKPVIAKLKDTVASVVDSREITDQKSETQKKALEVSLGKESEDYSDVARVSKIEVSKEPTSTTADVILKDVDPKLENNFEKLEEELKPVIAELKYPVASLVDSREITDQKSETQKKALEGSPVKERENDSDVEKVSEIVSKEPTEVEIIPKIIDSKLEEKFDNNFKEEFKPPIGELKSKSVKDAVNITNQEPETKLKILEVSRVKESNSKEVVGEDPYVKSDGPKKIVEKLQNEDDELGLNLQHLVPKREIKTESTLLVEPPTPTPLIQRGHQDMVDTDNMPKDKIIGENIGSDQLSSVRPILEQRPPDVKITKDPEGQDKWKESNDCKTAQQMTLDVAEASSSGIVKQEIDTTTISEEDGSISADVWPKRSPSHVKVGDKGAVETEIITKDRAYLPTKELGVKSSPSDEAVVAKKIITAVSSEVLKKEEKDNNLSSTDDSTGSVEEDILPTYRNILEGKGTGLKGEVTSKDKLLNDDVHIESRLDNKDVLIEVKKEEISMNIGKKSINTEGIDVKESLKREIKSPREYDLKKHSPEFEVPLKVESDDVKPLVVKGVVIETSDSKINTDKWSPAEYKYSLDHKHLVEETDHEKEVTNTSEEFAKNTAESRIMPAMIHEKAELKTEDQRKGQAESQSEDLKKPQIQSDASETVVTKTQSEKLTTDPKVQPDPSFKPEARKQISIEERDIGLLSDEKSKHKKLEVDEGEQSGIESILRKESAEEKVSEQKISNAEFSELKSKILRQENDETEKQTKTSMAKENAERVIISEQFSEAFATKQPKLPEAQEEIESVVKNKNMESALSKDQPVSITKDTDYRSLKQSAKAPAKDDPIRLKESWNKNMINDFIQAERLSYVSPIKVKSIETEDPSNSFASSEPTEVTNCNESNTSADFSSIGKDLDFLEDTIHYLKSATAHLSHSLSDDTRTEIRKTESAEDSKRSKRSALDSDPEIIPTWNVADQDHFEKEAESGQIKSDNDEADQFKEAGQKKDLKVEEKSQHDSQIPAVVPNQKSKTKDQYPTASPPSRPATLPSRIRREKPLDENKVKAIKSKSLDEAEQSTSKAKPVKFDKSHKAASLTGEQNGIEIKGKSVKMGTSKVQSSAEKAKSDEKRAAPKSDKTDTQLTADKKEKKSLKSKTPSTSDLLGRQRSSKTKRDRFTKKGRSMSTNEQAQNQTGFDLEAIKKELLTKKVKTPPQSGKKAKMSTRNGRQKKTEAFEEEIHKQSQKFVSKSQSDILNKDDRQGDDARKDQYDEAKSDDHLSDKGVRSKASESEEKEKELIKIETRKKSPNTSSSFERHDEEIHVRSSTESEIEKPVSKTPKESESDSPDFFDNLKEDANQLKDFILQSSATMIQKVFRGYRTRKDLTPSQVDISVIPDDLKDAAIHKEANEIEPKISEPLFAQKSEVQLQDPMDSDKSFDKIQTEPETETLVKPNGFQRGGEDISNKKLSEIVDEKENFNLLEQETKTDKKDDQKPTDEPIVTKTTQKSLTEDHFDQESSNLGLLETLKKEVETLKETALQKSATTIQKTFRGYKEGKNLKDQKSDRIQKDIKPTDDFSDVNTHVKISDNIGIDQINETSRYEMEISRKDNSTKDNLKEDRQNDPDERQFGPLTIFDSVKNDVELFKKTALDKSATTIQKTFRGYKTRKNLQNNQITSKLKDDISGVLAEPPDPAIMDEKEAYSKENEKLSLYSGEDDLRMQKRESKEKEVDISALNIGNVLDKSAVTIQKHFRGYQTRKNLGDNINNESTTQIPEEEYEDVKFTSKVTDDTSDVLPKTTSQMFESYKKGDTKMGTEMRIENQKQKDNDLVYLSDISRTVAQTTKIADQEEKEEELSVDKSSKVTVNESILKDTLDRSNVHSGTAGKLRRSKGSLQLNKELEEYNGQKATKQQEFESKIVEERAEMPDDKRSGFELLSSDQLVKTKEQGLDHPPTEFESAHSLEGDQIYEDTETISGCTTKVNSSESMKTVLDASELRQKQAAKTEQAQSQEPIPESPPSSIPEHKIRAISADAFLEKAASTIQKAYRYYYSRDRKNSVSPKTSVRSYSQGAERKLAFKESSESSYESSNFIGPDTSFDLSDVDSTETRSEKVSNIKERISSEASTLVNDNERLDDLELEIPGSPSFGISIHPEIHEPQKVSTNENSLLVPDTIRHKRSIMEPTAPPLQDILNADETLTADNKLQWYVGDELIVPTNPDENISTSSSSSSILNPLSSSSSIDKLSSVDARNENLQLTPSINSAVVSTSSLLLTNDSQMHHPDTLKHINKPFRAVSATEEEAQAEVDTKVNKEDSIKEEKSDELDKDEEKTEKEEAKQETTQDDIRVVPLVGLEANLEISATDPFSSRSASDDANQKNEEASEEISSELCKNCAIGFHVGCCPNTWTEDTPAEQELSKVTQSQVANAKTEKDDNDVSIAAKKDFDEIKQFVLMETTMTDDSTEEAKTNKDNKDSAEPTDKKNDFKEQRQEEADDNKVSAVDEPITSVVTVIVVGEECQAEEPSTSPKEVPNISLIPPSSEEDTSDSTIEDESNNKTFVEEGRGGIKNVHVMEQEKTAEDTSTTVHDGKSEEILKNVSDAKDHKPGVELPTKEETEVVDVVQLDDSSSKMRAATSGEEKGQVKASSLNQIGSDTEGSVENVMEIQDKIGLSTHSSEDVKENLDVKIQVKNSKDAPSEDLATDGDRTMHETVADGDIPDEKVVEKTKMSSVESGTSAKSAADKNDKEMKENELSKDSSSSSLSLEGEKKDSKCKSPEDGDERVDVNGKAIDVIEEAIVPVKTQSLATSPKHPKSSDEHEPLTNDKDSGEIKTVLHRVKSESQDSGSKKSNEIDDQPSAEFSNDTDNELVLKIEGSSSFKLKSKSVEREEESKPGQENAKGSQTNTAADNSEELRNQKTEEHIIGKEKMDASEGIKEITETALKSGEDQVSGTIIHSSKDLEPEKPHSKSAEESKQQVSEEDKSSFDGEIKEKSEEVKLKRDSKSVENNNEKQPHSSDATEEALIQKNTEKPLTGENNKDTSKTTTSSEENDAVHQSEQKYSLLQRSKTVSTEEQDKQAREDFEIAAKLLDVLKHEDSKSILEENKTTDTSKDDNKEASSTDLDQAVNKQISDEKPSPQLDPQIEANLERLIEDSQPHIEAKEKSVEPHDLPKKDSSIEVIETPCTKMIVHRTFDEEESELESTTPMAESSDTNNDYDNASENDAIETTLSIPDTLEAMTEKLGQAEATVARMQKRRASEHTSSIDNVDPPIAFDEPICDPIKPMRELQKSSSLETEDDIVLQKLQRDDTTRESSAESESVIFGDSSSQLTESEDTFNESLDFQTLKRMNTIAADRNTFKPSNLLLKSVTIDDTVKYIDPENSTEESGGSFSMDDAISADVRKKIMAYSISEADSDYYEEGSDQTNRLRDDFNISTALDTFPSSDTDTTIISAATKIQAGARGFLTRRRLRRASMGTKSSLTDTKTSFGNDAIGESLERLVEEEVTKRQPKVQYHRQVGVNSLPSVLRNSDETKIAVLSPTHEETTHIDDDSDELKLDELTSASSTTTLTGGEWASIDGQKDKYNLSTSSENDVNGLLEPEDESAQVSPNLEATLAARRLTLQRGDAMRNDSTPDDDNSNGKQNSAKNIPTSSNSATAGIDTVLIHQATTVESMTSTTTERKNYSDAATSARMEKIKWFAMRQNSMPVQIDSEVFRVLPKHMRKRIKSAEGETKRRIRLPRD